jgi:Bacterial Ig-like domain/Polysaccharide lyase family 4, domain II
LPPVSLQTKHMKRFFFFFLVCIVLMRVPPITGCANIIPPTGGPRDSLPPVLVNAQPAMNALRVSDKKIVLTFDEYIDLKDVRTNLIVSPVPKVLPTVTSHLKVVTIEMRDTLRPNTTYALDFGRSITDVNEGNVYKNFTYAFSTGSYVDSLHYSGKVVMAYTGKPDSTLIAMLHDKLYDSAVAKERPRYIARLDSAGNFTFGHVRPGRYTLYALKDETGTHEYTSKAQIFAFADSPVDLSISTAPLLLYAYEDTSSFKKPKKTLLPPPAPKKDEKDKQKRLLIGANLPNGFLDLHNQLELSFATPLKFYDSSKIRFTVDSFQNAGSYHLSLDTMSKKLTLTYAWKPGTPYHLILQKDFAEDTLGDKLLKIDTINFNTRKESDYGNLRLRFKNLDLNRHPVLLFFQGDKLFLSYKIGPSLRYNNRLFEPGDYQLRILYDTNQNGVWDPGDFYKHLQPEIAVPLKNKVSVRSNWDNEIDITL